MKIHGTLFRSTVNVILGVLLIALIQQLPIGLSDKPRLTSVARVNAQTSLACDPQVFHGLQHCGTDTDLANVLVVDLNDPHVGFQTVLSSPIGGVECNSVNGIDRDPNSNCPFPYPAETLRSMLSRYSSTGAVAIINTDYFGCGGGSPYPCGSSVVDHGAQGLAVRNGVRLDGPQHGVNNDIAYTEPSLAISDSKIPTIDIPGSQATIDNNLQSIYYNTVAGTPLIIENGTEISNPCSGAYTGDTCSSSSQSAAALTSDGKLILITARLNAEDTAKFLLNNFPNVTRAIKFDGGGSARMVWLDGNNISQTYSGTTENRPVAEGLLMFSDPIQSGDITIGSVDGQFFANTSNSGAFVAQPGDPVAFTQSFPVINFNPVTGTIPCTNPTGVGVTTRPFTDVVLQHDLSCITIPAQGNNKQAGLGDLYNFQAVFMGTFTLSGPSQVTFNFFSDDGWILSVGPNATGHQPTYVSGTMVNPPSVGPFSGYSVVGSYNQASPPAQNDLVVNFPTAGVYPFELDYSECCGGELVLTLTANSAPIPSGGSISGTVYRDQVDPSNSLAGALVQACQDTTCYSTLTSSTGFYTITSLPAGDYIITAFSPTNENLVTNRVGPVTLLPYASLVNQDIILSTPAPPPAGTTITNRGTGSDGLPRVFWGEPLTLTTQGCTGGNATYEILQDGVVIQTGVMVESSPGLYTATIQPLFPYHGYAHIGITVLCQGIPTTINFDVYIDPSGFVRSVFGSPVANATVTLYRSDSPTGPFGVVPNGSELMSPTNRQNPDLTDSKGRFGWDVVAGYYKVRAEHPYCHSPLDENVPFVETDILTIPPPVIDLDIRLSCQFKEYIPYIYR